MTFWEVATLSMGVVLLITAYVLLYRLLVRERHLRAGLVAREASTAQSSATLKVGTYQRHARAETIREIALALTASTDPVASIERSLLLLADVLPYRIACVALLDSMNYLLVEHFSPAFVTTSWLPIAQGVIQSGIPVRLADTSAASSMVTWATTAPLHPTIRCYLGVPLFRSRQTFAALSVMSRVPEAYHAEDVELMQTVANLFANAIEKAQMFRDMVQRERMAGDLALIGVRLSTILDEGELLNMICAAGLSIFEVQGAYLWLAQGDWLIGSAAAGKNAEQFGILRIPLQTEGWLGTRVIHEQRAFYVNQAQSSALTAPLNDIAEGRSLLAIPLGHGKRVLGVLVLADSKNEYRFQDRDLETGLLFGVQAALALENARLFAQTRRRIDQLRLVNEVGHAANALVALDSFMGGVSRPLFEEFHYFAVSLLLMRDEVLYCHSLLVNRAPIALAEEQRAQSLEGCAAYQAAHHVEPILQHDSPTLSMHLHVSLLEPAHWYELAVPLVMRQEVIGVLNVERRSPITTEELEVLEALSSQVATAIGNVFLFELVTDQMHNLDRQVERATAQVRLEKERTEAILRSVADSVIVTDRKGNVLTTNPMAERLLSEQPSLAAQVKDTVTQMIVQREPTRTAEIELDALTFQASAAQVVEPIESQGGAVVVLRDLTRLYELDRLKNQFISNVTHELKTPLTSIQLYVQLLREGKPERHPQYLDVLGNEAARLGRLINDLLDLSRLDQRVSRPLEPLDLSEVVGAAVATLRLQAEARQLELVFQPSTSPPWIIGNRDQLIQVWINLIGNAIRYTPVGGQIAVQIEVTEQKVNVEVRDNGIGISVEDQVHIFDRFYRGQQAAVSAVAGTGLGLSICKEIVELHGGVIGAQSEIGHGSIFRVTLSLAFSSSNAIIDVGAAPAALANP